METHQNATQPASHSAIALNLYALLTEWEQAYDTHDSIIWAQKHADLPIFAIAIYLVIVFYVPDRITTPWRLRRVWSLWNLGLSIFSMIGMSRTVPHLLEQYLTHGFNHTICSPPESWFLKGVPGAWVSMFIFSKVPELIDTVFLVLQKRPVIFLHWFHHVTVLMFCWHAYTTPIGTATGLYFATINYTVHSIMYFYYFLSIAGGPLRAVARPIAPLITMVQLLQMVAGATITLLAALRHEADPASCAVEPVNYRCGLAMYVSYLVLFAMLFYDHYLRPGGKHTKPANKPSTPADDRVHTKVTLCGVDLKGQDAVGFFHGTPPKGGGGGESPPVPGRRASSPVRKKKKAQ